MNPSFKYQLLIWAQDIAFKLLNAWQWLKRLWKPRPRSFWDL